MAAKKITKSTPAAAVAKAIAPVVPVTPAAPIMEKSEVKGLGKPKAPGAPTARTISHEDIAKRAFEIYANRGYTAGDQDADWHEAERQLKAGL